MTVRRCAATVVGAVLALLILAGCGAGSDSRAPRSVVVVTSEVTVTASRTALLAPAPTAQFDRTTAVRPTADASAFVGEWIGHTRTMTIDADGSGRMQVNSGAADGETWSFTWTSTTSGIAITLIAMVSSVGEGLGDLTPGQTYDTTLRTDDEGIRYLVTAGFGGDPANDVAWCNQARDGYSRECGA
ncbi:MAG: hypothetical protein QM662_05955 [Gordonia sp. (in: high G+C Gram-positive bacteria)]